MVDEWQLALYKFQKPNSVTRKSSTMSYRQVSIAYKDLQKNARGEHTRESSEPVTEEIDQVTVFQMQNNSRKHLTHELTL
jgi:hypothetical protein